MRSALVVALLSLSCAAPPAPPAQALPKAPIDWSRQAETPEQAALRLWSYDHGEASPLCTEHVHNADIRVLPEKELQEECHRETVAACMAHYDAKDGALILLKDNQEGKSYEILVHEYLHVIVVCSGILEGNNHSDPVWRHVPMSNLPPESPWFVPRNPPVILAPLRVVVDQPPPEPGPR